MEGTGGLCRDLSDVLGEEALDCAQAKSFFVRLGCCFRIALLIACFLVQLEVSR